MQEQASERQPIVHVVDDDEYSLRATARLLVASGYAVRTHMSADKFLEQLDEEAPGCVVADLEMPGVDGMALQNALAQARHPLPLLFLTGHGDIASTVQAMRCGAEDFVEKRAPAEVLLGAVQRALARDEERRKARARQASLLAPFSALTTREREVLEHVVRGRLNKQIAGDLGIHERTVKLHRMAMLSKLGVRSVAELTRLAYEAGLLSPLEEDRP
jgi:FixJ family two-component response regulator